MTARRHKASIKDALDCWRNSRALCEKFPVHTSEARAHRQPRQLCANTELSSPPLFEHGLINSDKTTSKCMFWLISF